MSVAGRGIRQQNGSAGHGDLCQGENGLKQLLTLQVKAMNVHLRKKTI